MKKNKTIDPSEYTPIMAIVDFLPVIAFCVGGVFAYTKIGSIIFLIGVIISTIAGMCKAGWKLIISLTKKDHRLLTTLFHIMLPLGFVVMLIGIPFSWDSFCQFVVNLFNLPSLVFSIVGCACMGIMMVFAFTLDGSKASSNWIEQSTNTIAQVFFVIAIILIK